MTKTDYDVRISHVTNGWIVVVAAHATHPANADEMYVFNYWSDLVDFLDGLSIQRNWE